MSEPRPPAANALGRETSPYLRQHANNPVHWLPWSGDAFEAARALERPVFLSVGYSTCHWCHVMARESFENPRIAEILNRHFINIKVDREERPDVDRLYMGYVQAATGSGGWPMSVWLTPDGDPFFGGTYFPPDDRYGRPGFPRVLLAIAEAWRSRREEIAARAAEAFAGLQERPAPARPPIGAQTALRQFESAYDSTFGGFGSAPKFPRPAVFSLLLRAGPAGREMSFHTLRRMALGGMHDALGGGFHRYSVDRFWHVPHFEKMLYDQAQLAISFLEAWQLTGDDGFRVTAESTLDYILRDLSLPEGGFCSGEDADSAPPDDPTGHAEGAFYVWRDEEIRRALDEDEARAFRAHFGVRPEGNAPPGSDPHGELAGLNVLHASAPPSETARALGIPEEELNRLLSSAKCKLRSIRDSRPRPHRDDKVVAAWNGLAISALAQAAAAFENDRYAAAALRAAEFVRREMSPGGRLLRSWCGRPGDAGGFAEDHAFLAAGLLDLHEVTGLGWALEWAASLQATMDGRFWDPEGGGYMTSAGDDPLLRMKTQGDHDGAEPLADSVAARNLLRLARMGFRVGREPAEIFDAWAGRIAEHPTAFPALLAAWIDSRKPPRQAVLAGEPGSIACNALLAGIRRQFAPDLAVLHAGCAPEERRAIFAAMKPSPSGAALYLCENFACRAPIHDPAEIPDLGADTAGAGP